MSEVWIKPNAETLMAKCRDCGELTEFAHYCRKCGAALCLACVDDSNECAYCANEAPYEPMDCEEEEDDCSS